MAYTEITRRLFSDKLQALDQERQPSFIIGEPNERMLALLKRSILAARELKFCEQALKKLGARVENERLMLHYDRERVLRNQWHEKQKQRTSAVRTLRAQAQLDLIDMAPTMAKVYLRQLQAKLEKI